MEPKAPVTTPPVEGRSFRKGLWCKASAGPVGEGDDLTTMRLNVYIVRTRVDD